MHLFSIRVGRPLFPVVLFPPFAGPVAVPSSHGMRGTSRPHATSFRREQKAPHFFPENRACRCHPRAPFPAIFHSPRAGSRHPSVVVRHRVTRSQSLPPSFPSFLPSFTRGGTCPFCSVTASSDTCSRIETIRNTSRLLTNHADCMPGSRAHVRCGLCRR